MLGKTRLEKEISLTGKERGSKNELRVHRALERLMNYEELDYIFVDFYRTQRLSNEDKAGIDFVIHAINKDADMMGIEIIPLQVKSSKYSADKHKGSHPDIPVIVVNASKSDSDIDNELSDIIQNELRPLLSEE